MSIAENTPLPEYVKTAAIATFSKEELDKLPSQAFANPKARMFPCHSKAATFTSALYYSRCRNELPAEDAKAIDTFLEKAATFFQVKNDIRLALENLTQAEISRIKTASADEYAIVIQNDDGTVDRLLPIHNPENLKAAASQLLKYAARFPYVWRQRAAKKMLCKAAEFKLDLGSTIWEMAGIETATIAEVAINLSKRADCLDYKQGAAGAEFVKISQRLEQLNDVNFTPEMAMKLAELIDKIDQQTGLYSRYGEIPLPEQIFFTTRTPLLKLAKELIVQTTAGDVFYKTDLQKAGLAPFVALGSDLVDAVSDDGITLDISKAADVVRTLPLDDARKFARYMNDSGLSKSALWDQYRKRSLNRLSKNDFVAMFEEAGFNVDDADFQIAIRRKGSPRSSA